MTAERTDSDSDDHQRRMASAPCECPLEGWCQRHRRDKPGRLHWLCQNREDYRAKWDREAMSRQGDKPPAINDKVLALAAAYRKWATAGKPTRSEAAVARIFNEHCQTCDQFKPTKDGAGACGICGCILRRSGGLLNKIRWATEGCPVDKWQADIQ